MASYRGSWPRADKARCLQWAVVLLGGTTINTTASAGSFSLWGLDADYQLQGTYAAAVRLHDADDRIINAPPAESIPLPDSLKLPESNNYDDGDRNFKKGSLINNRVTLLGEFGLSQGDFGVMFRGDAFYDDVYNRRNDNRSRTTLNRTTGDVQYTVEGPVDRFSSQAEKFSGGRARMLDAYAYGSWYLNDENALTLRIGKHIAAWGESLFHAGISLAQAPADATKATVPGADVKSILLPVNQISMQLNLGDKWTVLGQYKLQYKPTELNPVGEFFSVADVVGPGAQFIYGIENPLNLSTYRDVNLLSDDVPELIQLVNDLLLPNVPLGPITQGLGALLSRLDPLLPDINLPTDGLAQPGAPTYANVERIHDIVPSDHGQWGLGLKYQITPITNIGLYHLRYHNTTPAPVQNYGYAVLQELPGLPPITTAILGIEVPVTYNIRYFDGVHMSAMSFSTALFGANVGGEFIYRDGIDVLVDVDGGILGPVPTPTRGKVAQADINALYSLGPASIGNFPLWDSFTIVGDVGYISVLDVDPASGPTSSSTDLSYSKDATAASFLLLFDRKNIFSGWDLQIPVALAAAISGQTSLLSGFGSLMGDRDRRASIGFNFTWLQRLQLGVTYSGYFGEPHFKYNPYADRDNLGFTAKYNF
jgi:hypothetical protein